MASEHEANMLHATEMLASLGVQVLMVKPLTSGNLYNEWVQTIIAKSRRVSAALDTTTRGLQSLSDHAFDAAMHIKTICDYLQTSFEATLDYRKPWSPQNRFGMNSTPELLNGLSPDHEKMKEFLKTTHNEVSQHLWLTHHFRNQFILLLLNHLNDTYCEPHILSDDLHDSLHAIMKELFDFADLDANKNAGNVKKNSVIINILNSYNKTTSLDFIHIMNKSCQDLLTAQISAEYNLYGFVPKWATEDPRFLIQQYMDGATEYTTNLMTNKSKIKNQFIMTKRNKQVNIDPTYNVSIWQRKLTLNKEVLQFAKVTYNQNSLMADLFNSLGSLTQANIAYKLGTRCQETIYMMTLGIVCRDYLLQSTGEPSEQLPPNSWLFQHEEIGKSAEYNKNGNIHNRYLEITKLKEPDANTTGTMQPAPQTTVNWMLQVANLHTTKVFNAICHGTIEKSPKPTTNVPIIDGCKVNVMWQQDLDLFSWNIYKQNMNNIDQHILAMHRRNSLWLCHFSKATEKLLCMFAGSVYRPIRNLPYQATGFGDYPKETIMYHVFDDWPNAVEHITNKDYWTDKTQISVPLSETNNVVKHINKLNAEFEREFPTRRAPFMPPHWWIQPGDTQMYDPPDWVKTNQAQLNHGSVVLNFPNSDDDEDDKNEKEEHKTFATTWVRPTLNHL